MALTSSRGRFVCEVVVVCSCLAVSCSGRGEFGGGADFHGFGGDDDFNSGHGFDGRSDDDDDNGFGFDGGDFGNEAGGSFGFESAPKPVKDRELQKRSTARISLTRTKRGYGYVGPVLTSVKTDYDGNFQWKTKHAVGRKFGGGYH